ncbi:fungal-specific transcription factor domain-containing protein [Cristinia sonorae]|uniref:Fungal-specific transcription factor domain-containing protein n=1 Tax=Cristinia sonorae TaxID=1940300 RepID=A0A8K0XUM4_9AGAR|nr:fungal-specific transcription factor domain-containing protein [Cristinia sonorae]
MSTNGRQDSPLAIPPTGVEGELIEYTKDGQISRMRSHAGNVPSLPQTKLCPLCPAKFTRTTHLNRHLRTHSNERTHVCERCQSQFTRSDLLARHKRNCGDSSTAHRSRRKSCQACADSKIRCDQQQPCSKCQSRGRECVYRITKTSTGSTKSIKTRREHKPKSPDPSPTPSSETPAAGSSSTPSTSQDTLDASFPRLSVSESSSSSSTGPVVNGHVSYQSSSNSNETPSLSCGDTASSYSESYFTSTATDVTAEGYRSNFAQEALDVQNQLNALFSNEMFDKFFANGYSENGTQSHAHGTDHYITPPPPVSAPPNAHSHGAIPDFSYSNHFEEHQPFMAGGDPYALAYNHQVPPPDINAMSPFAMLPPPPPPPSTISDPLPSELEYYLHLFFTKFLEQMPLVHAPTFNVGNKPPLLISAMQACGAVYVKCPASEEFIAQTLANSRDEIMAAFARKFTALEDQIHLILAVSLLQTIGLFHERAHQRSQSTIYHSMLVMMVRQTGLLQSNANWTRSILDSPTLTEQMWKDWVYYETTKRALTQTFLHDCCHTIYYTLPPTYFRQEYNLHTPCDDSLWTAASAHEWYLELMRDIPGQTPESRLRGGPCVQDCLSHFARVHPQSQPALILNPFSQFVVIHGILRKLFEDCLDSDKNLNHKRGDGGSPTVANSDEYTRVNPTIQYMLHNWLQSWLQSPDTPKASKGQEPAFFHDGLPFYWIAQVLLLAYQESLPPFGSDNPAWNLTEDAKYGLMKEWFKHVRAFLRRGEQGPTLFWDELMKIRMDSWQSDIAAPDQQEGLLDFFEKR